MNNFTFCSPTKVAFGIGTENSVGILIKEHNSKRVLLHYGGGSIKKNGLYNKIVSSLNDSQIQFIELSGVEPNPKIGLIREGVKICKEQEVDFILAVGGGSVIDSAKAIAAGAKLDEDVWNLYGTYREISAALPIGVVLTISAAGSELSPDSVVTNPEGELKRSFGSELLRPVFSVMNPEITFSVSKFQTACGIVDIMMHTFERYFTPTKGVELIDNLSEGLLRSVISAGEKAMKNPDDYEARATLMWAGSIAHNGLLGTGRVEDWATHHIEHEISGAHDHIAHGEGLAIVFPAWCKFVYHSDIERFCRFAVNVWGCSKNPDNMEITANEGIAFVENYFKRLGMPTRLSEIGIGEGEFEQLAEKCTYFGKRTIGGLLKLGKEDIRNIFRLAK